MDILKILTESANELYPEDLDLFETELDTGNYSADYIRECKNKMSAIKNWLKGGNKNQPKQKEPSRVGKKKEVISRAKVLNKSPQELFINELICIRNTNEYKKKFKSFIEAQGFVDIDYIDANIAMFESWELGAILSFMQMGELFLEKYFDVLDPIKISRYQQFSEQFFMKHFSQLDATIVLTKGKNAWRKKENRSKQLDVFLRLKGIKL